jgi:hypothetical protein
MITLHFLHVFSWLKFAFMWGHSCGSKHDHFLICSISRSHQLKIVVTKSSKVPLLTIQNCNQKNHISIIQTEIDA